MIERKTLETDIKVKLNVYGSGIADINTGIGFFDHMLTALCVHSGWDLFIQCNGDLNVDCHHSIEDIGIVLGQAFDAEVNKNKIARYGSFYVPMDESLCFASLDISARPFLVFDCDFRRDMIGTMDSDMVKEFFRAFAFNAKITLHIKCLYGENDHHKAEGIFKAVAKSLAIATTKKDGKNSTKGVI